MRLDAAVEQDRRKGHAADQVSGVEIVERNFAQSVLTGEHSKHEKHQEDRSPHAARGQTGENPQQAKCGGNQDHLVGEFHMGVAEGNQVW